MNKFKMKTKIICHHCSKQVKYKKSLEQVGSNMYVHKGCWNKFVKASDVYNLV